MAKRKFDEFGLAEIEADGGEPLEDIGRLAKEFVSKAAPVAPPEPQPPINPQNGTVWTLGSDTYVWDGMHTWIGQVRPNGTRPPNR